MELKFNYDEMDGRQARIAHVSERMLRAFKETRKFRWISYRDLTLFIGEPNCERAVAKTCSQLPYFHGVPVFMFTKADGTCNTWTNWAKRQPGFHAVESRDRVFRWMLDIPITDIEDYPMDAMMSLDELKELMQ